MMNVISLKHIHNWTKSVVVNAACPYTCPFITTCIHNIIYALVKNIDSILSYNLSTLYTVGCYSAFTDDHFNTDWV